jgi:hypothetical protein
MAAIACTTTSQRSNLVWKRISFVSYAKLGHITQLGGASAANPLITGCYPFGRRDALRTSPERAPMFRFDQLIRRDMIIRDVKQRHPETIPVFDALHFRTPCDDCDIETVARKNGLKTLDVIDALNQAAFSTNPESEDHASNQ